MTIESYMYDHCVLFDAQIGVVWLIEERLGE